MKGSPFYSEESQSLELRRTRGDNFYRRENVKIQTGMLYVFYMRAGQSARFKRRIDFDLETLVTINAGVFWINVTVLNDGGFLLIYPLDSSQPVFCIYMTMKPLFVSEDYC